MKTKSASDILWQVIRICQMPGREELHDLAMKIGSTYITNIGNELHLLEDEDSEWGDIVEDDEVSNTQFTRNIYAK